MQITIDLSVVNFSSINFINWKIGELSSFHVNKLCKCDRYKSNSSLSIREYIIESLILNLSTFLNSSRKYNSTSDFLSYT